MLRESRADDVLTKSTPADCPNTSLDTTTPPWDVAQQSLGSGDPQQSMATRLLFNFYPVSIRQGLHRVLRIEVNQIRGRFD